MVVFDSSILLYFLFSNVKSPINPSNGKPVPNAEERIKHLVKTLTRKKEAVLIPTPVLSEVLVNAAGNLEEVMEKITTEAVFRVSSFDQRAAIELSIVNKEIKSNGGFKKNAATKEATMAKIKFDRQIVAIAVVEGAHTIYSDDEDIKKYATESGLECIGLIDLDVSDKENKQFEMEDF